MFVLYLNPKHIKKQKPSFIIDKYTMLKYINILEVTKRLFRLYRNLDETFFITGNGY